MNTFHGNYSRSVFDYSSSLFSRRQFFKFGAVARASTSLKVALHGVRITGAIAKSSLLKVASSDIPIRVGVVGLFFYRGDGGVVRNILAFQDYQVTVTEGSHSEIFPVLG